MAERKFTTYDGVKFREYTGIEIGNTGHYQIEVDKIKDITISGTYLDNWENVKEFRKIFYNFINTGSKNYPQAGYNFILIGENYLKSFHRFISLEQVADTKIKSEEIFNVFLSLLKEVGLVNTKPVIVQKQNYDQLKIELISRDPPYKKFNLYLISLDKNSIYFTPSIPIEKEDIQ